MIYVGKWPFTGGNARDWWKDYIKRPNPSVSEYRFLKANLSTGQVVSIFADVSDVTVKSKNSSINRIQLDGASLDYEKLFEINIERGRYFTSAEVEGGRTGGFFAGGTGSFFSRGASGSTGEPVSRSSARIRSDNSLASFFSSSICFSLGTSGSWANPGPLNAMMVAATLIPIRFATP